ncbi:MAG: DUF2752 domain-containing protein [Kiritimatiellaeota bacterium]|nr:DUF2752 domain-containing protein [Kiritimatiellota bacterium]
MPEQFPISKQANPAAPAPGGQRWLRMEQPADYRAVLRVHLPWVGLLAPVFLVAAFVPVIGELPFTMCAFRNLTGYPCLFCGFTRAFVALAHGRWSAAALQCPAAIPVFAVAAGLLAWHALGLVSGRIIAPGSALRPGRWTWALGLMGGGAVLLANWIYRLAAGLP